MLLEEERIRMGHEVGSRGLGSWMIPHLEVEA